MEQTTEYGDARECLQAARQRMRQVKRLLAQPSMEAADESAALLRDVEVQLGCVAAILRQNGSEPDQEFRSWSKSCKTKSPFSPVISPKPTNCFPVGSKQSAPVAAVTPTAAWQRLWCWSRN